MVHLILTDVSTVTIGAIDAISQYRTANELRNEVAILTAEQMYLQRYNTSIHNGYYYYRAVKLKKVADKVINAEPIISQKLHNRIR